MLKYIGLLIVLTISSNIIASEYNVIIKDNVNNEVVVTKCDNENDLMNLASELIDLKDEGISFKITKLQATTKAFIKKGGGEGGTD